MKFRTVDDKQTIEAISKDCFSRETDVPPVVIMAGYDFCIKGTLNYQHRSPEWEILKYQDVAAAIQNMQLYCESMGLACCWLSFFTEHRQDLLSSLNIKNDNIEYISGLAISFAKNQILETVHPWRKRRKVERKKVEDYILFESDG